ncbi:MAG: BadF/BadG/BcrA/BcrD ATPase family protein [Chloroflexota bacterium]
MTKRYFLGIDVGGSKTHALIVDDSGQALGFASAGPGNWEAVGYDGLTNVLLNITSRILKMTNVSMEHIAGVGMGIAGYDWPCQRQAHLDAIHPLNIQAPIKFVNDVILGILAGSEEGWGISVVAGTGCNCRGWSKDHQREGRVVGGAGYWSGEAAGGFDLVARAMRQVTYAWAKRGPATALSQALIQHTGAKDLDDLIEGVYLNRYGFDLSMVLLVFQVAEQGDSQALEVIRWAGEELGQMVCSVVNQLSLHNESFDVVMIGSLFDGHPLLTESLRETVHKVAPQARLVRLSVPPVVGAVLLGMEAANVDFINKRERLIRSTNELLNQQNKV